MTYSQFSDFRVSYPFNWCYKFRRGAANFAMKSSNMHSRNFNRPAKIDTALNYFNEPGSIAPTDLHLGVTSTWSFKSKHGSRLIWPSNDPPAATLSF
ncbi:hypothetical protein KY285_016063 [Solanum tuberosum]|nr:hypothetical protein KY285_016063 [Solanum tuberosum]